MGPAWFRSETFVSMNENFDTIMDIMQFQEN